MTGSLSSALITKLIVSNQLDADDIRAVQSLRMRQKNLEARQHIVTDGQRPSECCLLAQGFAFRSKMTSDGERQVLSIHIPGEIPDLQSLHLGIMDHDLVTMTPCTLGFISHDDLIEINRQRPSLANAFWRETLIDGAIFREWIVNMGRRAALPRMANLLLEMHKRLNAIGLARDGTFDLPITQSDLGDCLGLSTVHVNRVLQHLRKIGMVTVNRSNFHILEPGRLEKLAGFDETYLHLRPKA